MFARNKPAKLSTAFNDETVNPAAFAAQGYEHYAVVRYPFFTGSAPYHDWKKSRDVNTDHFKVLPLYRVSTSLGADNQYVGFFKNAALARDFTSHVSEYGIRVIETSETSQKTEPSSHLAEVSANRIGFRRLLRVFDF